MKTYFLFLSDSRQSLVFKLQLLTIFILCAQTLTAQENRVDERPLTVGTKTERKVVGQEVHAYEMQLKRGQVLRVTLQEKGADAIVGIDYYANSQSAAASVPSNSGTGFMQESTTAIAEQDGIYKLIVIAKQTDEGVDARYEFTAVLNDSATADDTKRMEAESLLFLAGNVSRTNDKEKMSPAIIELEKGIKTWQSLGDKYWEAVAKTLIAGLASKIGESDKAEVNLLQALNLFDTVKNKAEIANAYAGLGNLYIFKKDTVKAGKYFNDADTLLKSIGDKRPVLSGANSQGLLDVAVNNLMPGGKKKKPADFERELSEAKKKNDEAAQIAVWTKYLFAVVLDEAADDESDETSDPDLKFENKTPEELREMLQKSEKLLENARNLEDKERRLYEKAAGEGLRIARKLKDRNAEMQILVLLGLGYADLDDEKANEDADEEVQPKPQIKNSENAKKYLIQGLALSKILNDKIFEFLAYAGFSAMYDDDNDKLGIFFGKKFVNSIHSYRKTFVNLAIREDQQLLAKYSEGAYTILASMLSELNRFDEALQVINLARDQEFYDYKLFDNQPPAKLSLTKNEEKNEKDFDIFLKDLSVKYANRPNTDTSLPTEGIERIFSDLEKNFVDEKDSEDDIVRNVNDAEEMKAALKDLSEKTGKNHITIHHIVSDDKENMFLMITPKNIKFFSGGFDSKTADFSEDYKENPDQIYTDFLYVLTSPDPKLAPRPLDPRPLGSLIYKSIFKSLENYDGEEKSSTLETELEKVKAQVIHWSLSGKLRYVPLAALYDRERKQYLVEQYENVIFTRAKKESFLIPPKLWTTGIGFGNANDLLSVKDEINTIFGDEATNQKALFAGSVFMNEKFNVNSLLTIRQTKPDFVHIASHFYFQPGEAGQSFLTLGDQKHLSLAEMQAADRLFDGVDLLTLSACQTAVQKEDATGKEIDSFAELAQRLGAKSVIATLWSIEDTSASKLMAEFYRLKQKNPNASKSEVLRLAQMTLLNGNYLWEESLKNRSRGAGSPVTSNNSTKQRRKDFPAFEFDKNAPFSHPYYWSPFVLYGGSNGEKISDVTIPQSPPRLPANNPGNTISARNSIAGTWKGKYICSQGVTGVTLKIVQNGSDIQGLFEFYPLAENSTFKGGSGIYKGVFDSNVGVMQLNGERWVNQPDIGWTLVGFSGSFDENRQIFNGRMLNANCGGIEMHKENSTTNDTIDFGNSSLTMPKVALKDVEAQFNNKMFDETIRLGNLFLQVTPDSKEANSYVGVSYLLKRDAINAVTYLEKAIKLGQPLTLPMKRLRIPLLGHAFEEVKISLLTEGVAIDSGDSVFIAKYSELTDSKLNTYYANFLPQCGTAQIKGIFTEVKKNSEKRKQDKKQFDLFPVSAYLVPKVNGQLVTNEAACNNLEDYVPTTIVSLISRLK